MTALPVLAGPGVTDAASRGTPDASTTVGLPGLDGFADGPRPGTRIGGVGDPGTLLLAGPLPGRGADLDVHLATWGPRPEIDGPGVRALLRSSGLDGRGGGGFPLGRKVETARFAGGVPLLVVNASESEPASAKDRTVCAERPHLVLDGAALAATALGVDSVVIHCHRSAGAARRALEIAVDERRARGLADPAVLLSVGPDRYVSGEASAVASFVAGGEARPRFATAPLAVVGPSGRPTVVTNAETVAHLAVLARTGPAGWAAHGDRTSPGPRLVTLAGAVGRPGRVLEVSGSPTVGDILGADGVVAPPAAVLVGGYAGTWVDGPAAWRTPWTRAGLAEVGTGPGCGLLGVLPHGTCGLAETARLVRYLAGESAGQCGTCAAGLPRLADACASLAAGRLRRRGVRHLVALGEVVHGSGACGHPDAVVRLVRSMLDVFAPDVVRHMTGRACGTSAASAVFAVPAAPAGPGAPDHGAWR